MPSVPNPLHPARLLRGAVWGSAATAVMSLVFAAGQLGGALDRWPPRLIVDTVLERLPVEARGPAAGVGHIGYGAAAGAAYSATIPRRRRGAGTGVLFGLLIWAASYEGWVPAMGVLPLAHRDRRARAVTVLLAHLVYGATLGAVARRAPAGGEQG